MVSLYIQDSLSAAIHSADFAGERREAGLTNLLDQLFSKYSEGQDFFKYIGPASNSFTHSIAEIIVSLYPRTIRFCKGLPPLP